MNADTWLAMTKSHRQELLRNFAAKTKERHPDFLALVRIPQYGIYASVGPDYQYAVFGRDSLEVAEDLLDTHKDLVEVILMAQARLQGVEHHDITEEEPGKICHEFRSNAYRGIDIPSHSVDILHDLQKQWGGAGTDTLLYFGSFDATPLYIRLMGRYVDRYGPAFLNQTFFGRDGQERSLADSMRRATEWLLDKLEQSPSGLLEFKRLNNQAGIINQAWKDSPTSYVFRDGQGANWADGIASIELQGYAYDALHHAAQKIAQGDEAADWQSRAQKLQQTTLQKLWMPDDQFFAQGLDRDDQGLERHINTWTSNAGALLDSNLLKDLPPDRARSYTEPLVQKLMSQEFLTQPGIRCRARRHADIPDIIDYHGTYTVWPKETYDIAKGLRNHGYTQQAKELETRIIQAVIRSGEFYEFFYVDLDEHTWHDREAALKYFAQQSPASQLPIPEPGQAWTISAFLAICARAPDPIFTENP